MMPTVRIADIRSGETMAFPQEGVMTVDDLAIARARRSLEGLSLGDAFGQLHFKFHPRVSPADPLPPGPWRWTDDTHMALSIVETLAGLGRIEQDPLVRAFARRFAQEPNRGYGPGAARLLTAVVAGADWRIEAAKLFGEGSYGNGAAMRAAPIGAFFHRDTVRAASEARLSALVTHAHPEGVAGAVAVAVAAALSSCADHPAGEDFIAEVAAFIPDGETHDRLRQAMGIPANRLDQAISQLGTGYQVSAQDTVPYCLWVAAHHLDDFEAALWSTVAGKGDCDTTCAIVGGIVAMSAREMPASWLARREAFPKIQ